MNQINRILDSYIPFILFILVNLTVTAHAHEGPPYPIIVDQPSGPYVITVWADPDVGVGTFYVTLEAAGGGELPEELVVEIVVPCPTLRAFSQSGEKDRPALPLATIVAARYGLAGRVNQLSLADAGRQSGASNVRRRTH